MSYEELLCTNSDEFGKTMELDDLVAVHLTSHLPKDGTIQALNSVFPLDSLRTSVHFAINHPVSNVSLYGNWDDTKYAVISPFGALCEEGNNHVWNFNVVDTYFVGDVKLPEGSTVIATSSCYKEMIKAGIANRDQLMAMFADERCPPEPEDKLVVEKEGISYVILSWNSEDLRTETYHELARQGYACMSGGMWNWGNGNWGASPADQKRIATKIGAKTGNHCDDRLSFLEHFGSRLSYVSNGKGKDKILAFGRKLAEVGEGGISWHLDFGEDEIFEGFRHLTDETESFCYSPNRAVEAVRYQEEVFRKEGKLTPDLKMRIDRFIDGNVQKVRKLLNENPHLPYELAA
jgi:hypothetical protein